VRLGISLNELQRRSGVDKATLSLIENGRMIPTSQEYDAVTRALREAAAHKPGTDAA